MQFYVLHGRSGRSDETFKRTDLIQDVRLCFGPGDLQVTPPETKQIGEARMCADSRSGPQSQTYCPGHHQWIPGMPSAGDIG